MRVRLKILRKYIIYILLASRLALTILAQSVTVPSAPYREIT